MAYPTFLFLSTIIDVSVHMNEDQVAEAETAGYDF